MGPDPAAPRRAAFDVDEFAAPEALEPDDLPDGTEVSRETALPRPERTRILVVANQKGGVGKTTTAVNIGTALARGGLNVLLLDLDPQGNASTGLGIDHPEGTAGTYEVLIGDASIVEVVQHSPEASSLWVLPATIDLAGAEIGLVSLRGRETRLLHALHDFLSQHPMDYVIIDCPPSLGLLTLNALVAADEIMIPIQCEFYALEGVTQLLRTIDLVKGGLNDRLRLSTVVLTMYDGRTRLSQQVAAEVRQYFPTQTLQTVIPRSVRVAEAPSYGQSVLSYHAASAGAQAYQQAAVEIAHQNVQAREPR